MPLPGYRRPLFLGQPKELNPSILTPCNLFVRLQTHDVADFRPRKRLPPCPDVNMDPFGALSLFAGEP